MSTYTVRPGEGIVDVVENATGSVANWDAVLTANDFDDWTPELVAGQVIQIPDAMVTVDANTQRQLSVYPACNEDWGDVADQVAVLFSTFTENWILATGFWNGDAVWTTDGLWNT